VTIAANIVLYQLGWLACVLGAARGLPWVGVTAAAAIVAWHLARAARPGRELALVALAALLGLAFETVLVRGGWVSYPHGALLDGAAPLWMAALWALFATTLNVSLRPLRARPWFGAVLGAAGAPLAYYAGARLGALHLAAAGSALAVIGAGWALCTPALFAAARRLDGYPRP